MKRTSVIVVVLLVVAIVLGGLALSFPSQPNQPQTAPSQTQPPVQSMLLTSPSFQNGGMIPTKFSCDDGGVNPELEIQNVPPSAASLALIVHDPDAPLAGGFAHWVVWNIDPGTTVVKEDSVPSGSVEGNNGAGKLGWTAPCPPSGTHHYHFMLYALGSRLVLPQGASDTALMAAMQGNIITQTDLVGLYAKIAK
jgi:Raf kinase inhibitor-like YbhB/YbcL family protein